MIADGDEARTGSGNESTPEVETELTTGGEDELLDNNIVAGSSRHLALADRSLPTRLLSVPGSPLALQDEDNVGDTSDESENGALPSPPYFEGKGPRMVGLRRLACVLV